MPVVERLKVPASEILVGDVIVGWDRSGARETVVRVGTQLPGGQISFGIDHRWGTTTLYIPRDARVFIERISA